MCRPLRIEQLKTDEVKETTTNYKINSHWKKPAQANHVSNLQQWWNIIKW